MAAKGKVQKEYDYVFEDLEQTFVMTEQHKGTDSVFARSKGRGDDDEAEATDDKLETPLEKKKREMKAVRDSLPVFPYREPFLQAVRDHQVPSPLRSGDDRVTRGRCV